MSDSDEHKSALERLRAENERRAMQRSRITSEHPRPPAEPVGPRHERFHPIVPDRQGTLDDVAWERVRSRVAREAERAAREPPPKEPSRVPYIVAGVALVVLGIAAVVILSFL